MRYVKRQNLAAAFAVSRRLGKPLSVLLLDIDHFKSVNDTYGHQAGDHVLVTVAQMLKGESRDNDLVGRVGGEEFLAVLSNCGMAGALAFAARFRQRVEKPQIFFEGKRVPMTVIVGT
ncbi:MAG: GGDEF domain-containing protein, partial [Chloroflexi bacterium]|nr:GGDEF domain-containing protein [Chloroflexota bacterium]